MSVVAPKTFNQLRFFTTFFVGVTGFYTGVNQRSKNQAAWDEYYAKKFKAQAEAHEAAAAAKRPKAEISSEVPEELRELAEAFQK